MNIIEIIFEIENGIQAEDFEGFLIYIRYVFYQGIMEGIESKHIDKTDKEEIAHSVLDAIANNFCKDISVDFVNEMQISKLNLKVKELFKEINSYEEYLEHKGDIKEQILEYKF